MSRPRATYHCMECRHYFAMRRLCVKGGIYPVSSKQERTSPYWCPLGHVIPGRPYPTFTPGKDPRSRDLVDAAIRRR